MENLKTDPKNLTVQRQIKEVVELIKLKKKLNKESEFVLDQNKLIQKEKVKMFQSSNSNDIDEEKTLINKLRQSIQSRKIDHSRYRFAYSSQKNRMRKFSPKR